MKDSLLPQDRIVALVIIAELGAPDGVHTFLDDGYLCDFTGFTAAEIDASVVRLHESGILSPAKTAKLSTMGAVIVNPGKFYGWPE